MIVKELIMRMSPTDHLNYIRIDSSMNRFEDGKESYLIKVFVIINQISNAAEQYSLQKKTYVEYLSTLHQIIAKYEEMGYRETKN